VDEDEDDEALAVPTCMTLPPSFFSSGREWIVSMTVIGPALRLLMEVYRMHDIYKVIVMMIMMIVMMRMMIMKIVMMRIMILMMSMRITIVLMTNCQI
jgi:hypothetical protein